MPSYWVIVKTECPDCDATGVTVHPSWQAIYDEYDETSSDNYIDTAIVERMLEKGLTGVRKLPNGRLVPPEEIVTCPTCHGGCWIEHDVNLNEVLNGVDIAELMTRPEPW